MHAMKKQSGRIRIKNNKHDAEITVLLWDVTRA